MEEEEEVDPRVEEEEEDDPSLEEEEEEDPRLEEEEEEDQRLDVRYATRVRLEEEEEEDPRLEEEEEEVDPWYKEIDALSIKLGLRDDPTEAYHSQPGPPEGEYSRAKHMAKGGAGKVNSHWVLDGDAEADGKFEGDEMLDPQTKLQLILRKAFEYRMLNSMEAQYVRKCSDDLTFLSLVLSGISSILLLTNYHESSAVIAATLTAAVTTLTGYNSYMQFTNRYEKHTASVKAFANLQRDVMADLQTKNDDEITDNFTEYSMNLSAAIAKMPLVEQSRMNTYRKKIKKEDGSTVWESFFPNISDMARWNESVENIKSMKDLDIFTTRPQVEDDEKVTKRLSKTVDSYMDKLSTSVKVTEHRKVLKGSSSRL
jgi:hypothetical protein